MSIVPAMIGGLFWRTEPAIPFLVAAGFGLLGAVVFTVTVQESSPWSKPPAGPNRTD